MASIYDFIRAAALVIGLGFSAQQDRKSWMWADSVLWGCYALGLYLFPGLLLPGNDSAMMVFLTRGFAASIFGMETMWYLTRKTRDENVVGATLWSRLVSSSLLLTILSYNCVTQDKFPEKTLYFDMLAYTMLMLTSVYQFWRRGYRVGGREQKGNVSLLLRIIFLLCFVGGLVTMAFPSWVVATKKLEVFEMVIVRCIGAVCLGGSFTALYATSFRFDEDKSSYFLSVLVTLVLSFINLSVATFVHELFNPMEALFMHLGIAPACLVILGLYLLRDAESQTEYNLRSRS